MQAMELLTPASRPAFLKPDDGVLLSSYEAEKIVEELKCLGVDKVGSPGWLKQREYLEKLNLQAHYNTLSYSDEFVMAALISFGKMGILVHELIIIEVILYHREACDALGEDALLEVVDYCYRKLVYLNIGAREDAAYKERKAQELLSMNPEDEMTEKAGEVTFACAICALSVLRYLSDYVGELPLCVMARLIDANDVIMATVPLVESPPWQRLRKHQNKTMREKFVEGKWVEIPPQDYSKLTKSDAQAWLILNNLIVDSRCRSKYIYDDFRLSQVLKLRKYLTEVLVDQLPVLKDLQWVVEELSLKLQPSTTDQKVGYLIMEQVPEIRRRLLDRKDWKKLAEEQLSTIFCNPQITTQTRQHFKEMMHMFEFGESMEAPKCAACGVMAVQRCSQCKSAWYCSRNCQVSNWKSHKKICNLMANNI